MAEEYETFDLNGAGDDDDVVEDRPQEEKELNGGDGYKEPRGKVSPGSEIKKTANPMNDESKAGMVKSTTLTPMEIAMADDDIDDEEDDMESLLPGGASAEGGNSKASKKKPLPTKTYLNGWIKPQSVGNMHILFPEYFQTSGFGVLGPHWFGPACVWLILVVATHFCLRRSHQLGIGSVLVSFFFFGVSTYLLTDVSFRDPGICLDTCIPCHVPPDQVRGWRWCDFCKVYQPPDGAHCPDCNVCVAGYDHHCVWMGTCIGKKNYRQFVKFNVSWLYYVGYAIVWLAIVGPLVKHTS